MRALVRIPYAILIPGLVATIPTIVIVVGIALAQRPGPSWQSAGLPHTLVHSLALDTRSTPMIAGAHDGIYGRDGSRGWRRLLMANDVWEVSVASDGTMLGADNDGYVDVSHDGGRQWRRSFVTNAGCFAVAARPSQPRDLLAGCGGGIYVSVDGGRRWTRRLALPGAAGAALVWQPGSNRTVYAGAVSGSTGGSTLVYVSRDAGDRWRVLGRSLESTGGIMSLAAERSGRVFAGTMGNAVWRVTGLSGTWQKSADGMPPVHDHVATIAGIPGASWLFAGTLGYGVFRSGDGTHWTGISGNLTSLDTSIVLAVVYSPRERALYAGTDAGIYRLPLAEAVKQ